MDEITAVTSSSFRPYCFLLAASDMGTKLKRVRIKLKAIENDKNKTKTLPNQSRWTTVKADKYCKHKHEITPQTHIETKRQRRCAYLDFCAEYFFRYFVAECRRASQLVELFLLLFSAYNRLHPHTHAHTWNNIWF